MLVSAVHILQTRRTDGISLGAIGIHMAVSCFYFLYGWMRHDRIIIVSSIVSILCNIVVSASTLYVRG